MSSLKKQFAASFFFRFVITICLCCIFVSPAFRAEILTEPAEIIEKNCYSHTLAAMRGWNYEKYKATLRIADQVGVIHSQQKEYCQNLLDECDTNAIVFTQNLRDTMPLMYLQHVEKIRQDVAILPITLLDEPWFLNVMKQDGRFVFNTPGFDLDRSEIIQFPTHDILPERYEVDPPPRICREYGVDSSQNKIVLNLDEGWISWESDCSPKSMQLVLNVLAKNRWRRPVFISSACDSSLLKQIQNRLRCEGLVFRILPYQNLDQHLNFAWQKVEALFTNPDHFVQSRDALKRSEKTNPTYHKLAHLLVLHKQDTDNAQGVQELLSVLSANIGYQYIVHPKPIEGY